MKTNISPADLLGAVLMAAGQSREFNGEQIPILSIEHRPEGIICTLPMKIIEEYKKKSRFLQFEVIGKTGMEETAVMTLEETTNFSELLSLNGGRTRPSNSLMVRFVNEMNGMKDDANKIAGA